MVNYCTLFDSYYIHKGIALYLSLERVADDFHLYVMAFDKDCYQKLKSIGFKKMTVELVDDFETQELLEVKPSRTKAEYCWTCGPSVIYHFMTKYGLEDITYLDSDLFFLSDPHVVYEETKNASVVITEQGVGEQLIAQNGRYCVQYLTFKNDKDGIGALSWWRDRCIEWCYSRYEDGKYGDQKYLEQFEVLFNNVHVVQHRGFLGPWDVPYLTFTDKTVSYKGKEYPFVFFHMSGTRFELNNGILKLRSLECAVPPKIKQLFYSPYVELMKDIYINYFGKDVKGVSVHGRSKLYISFVHFRRRFRDNKIAYFIYYKILGKRYNGRGEEKKV